MPDTLLNEEPLPYELPELIVLEGSGGAAYSGWVDESTRTG